MTNILNLALKKEIFDGLLNQTNNEIPIEKSNWWKKRLMDLDTGRFKPFDTVKASCGSSDKYDFHIVKIEDRKDQYVVTVSFESELLKPAEVNPVKITDEGTVTQESKKTVEEIQEEINKKILNEIKDYAAPAITIKKKETIDVNEVYKEDNKNDDWKKRVYQLLSNFCSYENVYLLSTPDVEIRSNGQIMGTNRKIFMHRDFDMKFPFKNEEYIKYSNVTGDEFYDEFYNHLKNLLNGNLIFIKRGSFGFKKQGDLDVFCVKMAVKKTYMFR